MATRYQVALIVWIEVSLNTAINMKPLFTSEVVTNEKNQDFLRRSQFSAIFFIWLTT